VVLRVFCGGQHGGLFAKGRLLTLIISHYFGT